MTEIFGLPTKLTTGIPMTEIFQINFFRSETATSDLIDKIDKGKIHIALIQGPLTVWNKVTGIKLLLLYSNMRTYVFCSLHCCQLRKQRKACIYDLKCGGLCTNREDLDVKIIKIMDILAKSFKESCPLRERDRGEISPRKIVVTGEIRNIRQAIKNQQYTLTTIITDSKSTTKSQKKLIEPHGSYFVNRLIANIMYHK